MKCPRCQHEEDPGARFGVNSGARLEVVPTHLTARVSLLVLAALAIVLVVAASADIAAQEREEWKRHLERAESAASRGDVASALKALDQAYLAALDTGRWEGVVEYADAMLHLRERARLGGGTAAKAREAYLIALWRARDAGSVEGMLRSAEGFARLGDFEALAYAARVIQLYEAREQQSP